MEEVAYEKTLQNRRDKISSAPAFSVSQPWKSREQRGPQRFKKPNHLILQKEKVLRKKTYG